MGKFVKVGTIWDIKPGERKSMWVEGTRVLVLNIDGKYYAVDDSCPHRECSMTEADVNGTIITCPCHRAQFDLSNGEIITEPTQYPPTPPLPTHQVRTEDGNLLIALSTDFDYI